jgi:small subunit ribosomal protein S6
MRSEILARNVYEAMFLLDSNRFSRDPDGISGEIAELIKKAGGEILVSRLWDERRLAYTIKGQRKGTYWLMYVDLDARQVAPLRRQFEITESILRFLVLKIDPRIVDALVAHAKSAPVPAAPPPEEPPVAVGVADESADEEVAVEQE